MLDIDAEWIDEDEDKYYEAHFVAARGESVRITSSARYGPLGDVWNEDDGDGGGFPCERPEFVEATIRLHGGPRDGEVVA